jgi:hypothetical protein
MNRQTNRQTGDLISLLSVLESRLKNKNKSSRLFETDSTQDGVQHYSALEGEIRLDLSSDRYYAAKRNP